MNRPIGLKQDEHGQYYIPASEIHIDKPEIRVPVPEPVALRYNPGMLEMANGYHFTKTPNSPEGV